MNTEQQRKRILLVDDEPDLVSMLGMRLELTGFEVVKAMDGEEALDKARSAGVDLILLDCMLPKINGYEVCRILKQDARFSAVPIFLLTALASDKDEERGQEAGADAYIQKPFDSQSLIAKIHPQLK